MTDIATLTNTIETSTDAKEILAAETALAKLRAEQRAAQNAAKAEAEARAKAQAEERDRDRQAKLAEFEAARADLRQAIGSVADRIVALALAARDADRRRKRLDALSCELSELVPGRATHMPETEPLRVTKAVQVALYESDETEDRTRQNVERALVSNLPMMVNAGLAVAAPRLPKLSQREAFAAVGLEHYDERADRRLADRVEYALRCAGCLGGSAVQAAAEIAAKVAEVRAAASSRGMTLAEVE